MQTALDTLINHDAPAICGQRYGSALEFERWLGEGDYGVRRGLQEKLDLVLTLDSFGERPLDPMFQDELQQYLIYYNTARPHQALKGKTPLETLQLLSSN